MTLRTSAAAALAAAALAASVVAPAHADEVDPAAPVVVNDEVTLWPGGSEIIDVLANDTDPGGADLATCRLPPLFSWNDDGPSVYVQDLSEFGEPAGTLGVGAYDDARGTHTIEYYVCNHTRLTPATLTVTIRPVAPVVVTKVPGEPGRIQVTNENDRRIWFVATDESGCKFDAEGPVRAHATRTFRVHRHTVGWSAFIGSTRWDINGVADRGYVRRIRLEGPPAPPVRDGMQCSYSYGRGAQPIG